MRSTARRGLKGAGCGRESRARSSRDVGTARGVDSNRLGGTFVTRPEHGIVDDGVSVVAQLGDEYQAGIVFAGHVSIAGTIQGDCGDEVAGAGSYKSGVA